MVIVPCDGLRRFRRRQSRHELQCSPQRTPITPQNSLAPHQLTVTMNSGNENGSEKGNRSSDSASFQLPAGQVAVTTPQALYYHSKFT